MVPTANASAMTNSNNSGGSRSTMNTEEYEADINKRIEERGYISAEDFQQKLEAELQARMQAPAEAVNKEPDASAAKAKSASSMSTGSDKGDGDDDEVKQPNQTYAKAAGLLENVKLPPIPHFTGSGPNDKAANNLEMWSSMLRMRAIHTGHYTRDGLLALGLEHLADGPACLCHQHAEEYASFDELLQFLKSSTYGQQVTSYGLFQSFFDGSYNIYSAKAFAPQATKMERGRAKMPFQVPDEIFIQLVLQQVKNDQLLSQIMTAPGGGEWDDYAAFRGFAMQKAAALRNSNASGSSAGGGRPSLDRGRPSGSGKPGNGDKRHRSQSRGSERGASGKERVRRCSACKSTEHSVTDFINSKPVCPKFDWGKYKARRGAGKPGADAKQQRGA